MPTWIMDVSMNTPNAKNDNLYVSRWANGCDASADFVL